MSDCIFCKIAAQEIPADVVYEDEYVIAFNDLSPMMPVHTLIIPKEHHAHMGDDIPAELMGKLFSAVPRVAEIQDIAKSGYRIQVNTGEDACQSVHHIHIHLLGGEVMNDGNPSKNTL